MNRDIKHGLKIGFERRMFDILFNIGSLSLLSIRNFLQIYLKSHFLNLERLVVLKRSNIDISDVPVLPVAPFCPVHCDERISGGLNHSLSHKSKVHP